MIDRQSVETKAVAAPPRGPACLRCPRCGHRENHMHSGPLPADCPACATPFEILPERRG